MGFFTDIFQNSSGFLIILISVGVVTLAVLIAYAWHLQGRLKTLEEKQKNAAREADTLRQQHIHDATQGIRILAGAMIREEVTLTEGSMRIAYLLTQADETAAQKQQYSVFFQLAEATAHIPVLDAWQKLSKQQQRAYTEERTNIEQAFQEFVVDATQQLLRDPILNEPTPV